MKRLIIGLLVVCLLVTVSCTTEVSESEVEEQGPTVTAVEKEPEKGEKVEEVLEEKIRPPTFEPIVITSSGDKTSPPFTVTTEEWTIDWSYVPNPEYPEMAIFGFFVYPRGETAIYVESVLFPEGTSGSTYSYAGAGEYYIKVTAANVKSWEIVISPP